MSNFNENRKIMRKNKGGFLPFLVIVAVAAVLALGCAGIWQLLESKGSEQPESSSTPSTSSTSQEESSSSQSSQPSSSEPPASSSQSSSGAQQVGQYTYAVPKNEWVDSDYFSDAVFFGDSLTNGIQLYDVMSNTTVVSSTGITLDNVLNKTVIKAEGGKYITMLDALKAAAPRKIYIMMGANSLGWDKDTFIKKYEALLDAVKAQHPDATIYVQSILPVTAKLEEAKPTFANAKIDEYNLALMELAKAKQMSFLYVAEDFKDESGCLPAEASPKDGIHFGRTYYMRWFDYLKTHTVGS